MLREGELVVVQWGEEGCQDTVCEHEGSWRRLACMAAQQNRCHVARMGSCMGSPS